INRLFGAMSQVTGGTLMAPGSVAAGAAGMATGAALGGVGGAMALATGSSLTQAAGIALGNNPTLSRAAYMTSMLPGLRETRIGQIAGEFTEGAIARSALGPVVGGAIIPPRRLEAHREQATDSAEAVTAYYHPRSEKEREARLERTFGAAAPQMARVMDAHSEDELLEIVAAVKAVRQSNPTLPAGSPAFQSAVMQRLPEDVQHQFSPEDLRLVVTATGASATERERLAQRAEPEPSPSERAVRDYYQNPDRPAGYAGLQTTFGPAAAPEMARVLDAHSEDDMAEVAAAVRSLQTTQPQIAPESDECLPAPETQLAARTSVPLRREALRTRSRGFAAAPSQQVLDTATLARAIGAAVGGCRQVGGARPLSFEQAA